MSATWPAPSGWRWKATRRPGADAELGGFGGVFDLKAAGFTDPLLVAANDGVGTKVKIAIESGRHDTIGIDLVAEHGSEESDAKQPYDREEQHRQRP